MNPEQPPKFNQTLPKNIDSSASSEGGNMLSSEQLAAIKLSAEIGRQIQKNFPEIATDYANGMSLNKLVEKYNIRKKFSVKSIKTAQEAVRKALVGHSWSFGDTYPGLIENPEILQKIREEHMRDSGKKIGKHLSKEGLGMFGIPEEEKRRIRSRAGMDLYQTGKGIHALSAEELLEASKAGVESRGITPISEEAKTFIRGLNLNDPEYITKKTKVNVRRIAEEVNKKFYEGKDAISPNATGLFIARIKK